MRLNYGKSDILFQIVILVLMFVILIICAYPIIYVFSMSISDPFRVAKETLWLLPKGFSTLAFERVIENPRIWISYGNTIWYTVVGTTINIVFTVMLAYPLSKKDFSARNLLMFLITFTMFFSGGLIPLYLIVNNLGLYNTRWAIVLPVAIAAWNTIIARTFFQSLPDSLAESAKLDGANDLIILIWIIVPLSKPIIAVLSIFYAVQHWNSFFSALLYLPDSNLHPLQLFLVKILIQNDPEIALALEDALDKLFVQNQIKYAAIVLSVLPIIMVYPGFQKYFVKGVMIGSIKG